VTVPQLTPGTRTSRKRREMDDMPYPVTPGQAALPPLPPKWTGLFRVLATVEAVQLINDLRNHTEVARWIEANGGHAEIPFAEPCLYVETPGGRKRAGIGDWIVKGVTGEFFPVEPDVFEATYEPAGDADLDDGRHPDECPCQFCEEDRREAMAQDDEDEHARDMAAEDGDYDACGPTL
jgi:hypothetical protein